MQQLVELLPHECRFDGCAYGLRARLGLPMLKGWRVQTDHAPLRRFLRRRCPGGQALL